MEGVDGFVDGMGGDITLEHDAKGGVVGEGRWVVLHSANQSPTEGELEELAEDVEHVVECVGGVMEVVMGLDVVEEVECAVPVVVVGEKGFANRCVIEMRDGVWKRSWGLWGGGGKGLELKEE